MVRRLFWKLYVSYLVVVIACTAAVGGFVLGTMRRAYVWRVAAGLEVRGQLVAEQIRKRLERKQYAGLDDVCERLGKASGTRITVILPNGVVAGDSDEEPAQMDNHADRPEIVEALAGRLGQTLRYSKTLRVDMMYVAMPVYIGESVAAVIRTSVPLTDVEHVLGVVAGRALLGAVAVAGLAAGVGLVVSRRISRPLERLREGAQRFAEGDFSQELPGTHTEEIASLATALNRMAAQLGEKIQTITQQRNEQEAILASMIEGVVAIDTEQRILSLNQAAGRLLNVEIAQAQGRNLVEVIRNADLQRLTKKILSSRQIVEEQITLHDGAERFVQVHGSVLRDGADRDIGSLLVIHDVTRLRRLETVRSDFVANVSHELMTPITAIKGFVETLCEGGMEDRRKATKFLGIIGRQADRLNAIIEDLLRLSRIEEEGRSGAFDAVEAHLAEVLRAAVAACEAQAAEHQTEIHTDCSDELTVRMNPQLIEQAVVNLLDNAIKYSDVGSRVSIDAESREGEIVIRVVDKGCGIAAEHLPRIFERFYRVDKARSRELGGTGLGLAIVKHIAQVHGGRVTVESTPGKGSMFAIHLPRRSTSTEANST